MSEANTKKRNAIIDYFEESYQELKKVTWPTRNQAVRLTLLVLGFCVVAAVVIGAMDAVFNYGHRTLVEYAASISPVADTQQVTDTTATGTVGNEQPVTATTTPVSVTATDSSGKAAPVTVTPVSAPVSAVTVNAPAAATSTNGKK